MARKDSAGAAHTRGLNDVIGLVLMALSLLLLVAQVSFDRNDVVANRVPANETVHNWIGSVGAHLANGLFFLFGAGAFLLSILLLIFAAGYFFETFAYLRRRGAWILVLFFSSLGLFDLYSHRLEALRQNLNAQSAGGLIGNLMNDLVFGHFGKPGATIIYVTLYLVSLLFLTNFRIGDWLRHWLAHSRARGASSKSDLSPEERTLARRAQELETQARKLQEQVTRSGIGADLKPVPAPTVRDLSVPQARPTRGSKPKPVEP